MLMTRYTHGHHESVLRSHSWRTADNSAAYLLPHLDSSASMLDIGAGPGTITMDFAEIAARVTATEIGEEELALSRNLAAQRGVTNIEFAVEDVHSLTFPDASFDIVHAHQVLQHVADPVAALREMGRVARLGGLVAARDSDYAGFVWWPLLPALDEWLHLYRTAARANGGEPDAGRRLFSWARSAGFSEITATSSTWCFSAPEDRLWWGGMWAERVTESALARQLVDSHLATTADLERIGRAWKTWANAEDGWFSLVHGEILARTGTK
ncbi:class I SAM-dependent methyltransferase [Rhodococcus sp. TAF43]|uniref:class I SAM-dependent methyltransferase n=1 Tax=Rhodococcus sp. TAF43 TaxID=3237483 RepID=UPI003F9BC11F